MSGLFSQSHKTLTTAWTCSLVILSGSKSLLQRRCFCLSYLCSNKNFPPSTLVAVSSLITAAGDPEGRQSSPMVESKDEKK